jgi:phosphate transport system protein
MSTLENQSISAHVSEQFNLELEDLRNKVLAMGGLVEKNISDAINSVIDNNDELAEKVIENDVRVNEMELAIDEECQRVIARRQPAAGDLRMIITVMKAISELERCGDEAEKIARMGMKINGSGRDTYRGHYVELRHMAEGVRKMLHNALDAFARMDVDTACTCIEFDQYINEEYESVMRQLITLMMEDTRNVKRTLDVIWCARALERIGDHAKKVCEYIVFMVTGRDIRHMSAEEAATEVGG